ncbi:MAG: hypothetical protein KAU62_01050 [Candidatus Heimdallarchaeota archaeon]|nr:hypothetical protein [Candidatus Heimdallarchaeota archaeon]MCK4609720.1 hypothetical protein [Candidatus Heimdallarchaeota archaeon]
MTWGLGSPRKLISSDENPFLSVDKEKAYKRTLRLLDSITISQDYVERKDKTQHKTEDANHWTAIYIFDVALEKKGKSARLKAVCDYFKSVYPEELFWSGKSKTKLESLYDSIPEGKQYVFVGVEDGTAVLKDRKKAEKARSKARRHICKTKTGYQAGVLIQYIGSHRWWDIDPLLRGDTTLVIFGSVTDEMNDFDSIKESKWLSSQGLDFLHEKDKQIQKVETAKGKRKSKQLERDLGFWFGMSLVRKSDKKLSVFYLPEVDDPVLFDLTIDEDIEQQPVYLPHTFDSIDLFDWEDKITDELKASLDYKEFAKYWEVLVLQNIRPYLKKARDLLGTSKDKNYCMKHALSGDKMTIDYWQKHGYFKDDQRPGDTKVVHGVWGYIIYIRGEKMFEQFVINACGSKELDLPHESKPQIKISGKTYEDDLKLGENIIINLKCGQGLHTYQAESFKTTQVFAKNNFETYLLYYDLETNLVEIYDKEIILSGYPVSVGSEMKEISRDTLSSTLVELCSRRNPSPLNAPQTPPIDKEVGVKTINQKHEEEKSN